MARLEDNDQLEIGARLGYGARGLVYLIVGWMAFLAAFGNGGRTTDTRGSLREILQEPAGDIMLAGVAAGLIGYAVWRFVQAIKDVDRHGRDLKGVTIRAGLAISGLLHLSLAFFAVSLVFGLGGGSSNSSQDWTAQLLSQQYGRWAVALVGLAVIGAGLAQMWKGWREKFRRRLTASPDVMRWAAPIARFGLMARGLVFVIIGGFFIVAAWEFNAGKARGLDGALEALQQQPFGPYLLAAVALGLIAFGIYSVVEGVYRRVGSAATSNSLGVPN